MWGHNRIVKLTVDRGWALVVILHHVITILASCNRTLNPVIPSDLQKWLRKTGVSVVTSQPIVWKKFTLDMPSIGETGPMLDTFSLFAIFRKIFVGMHFWYMLWMRLVHRYTLFFSKFFVEKFVLKRIFKFLTFLDTTGVILDRNLSHVGQSHYGQ